MMQTVRGIYRNGKVELLEPPTGITEGEVLVTLVQGAVGEFVLRQTPVAQPATPEPTETASGRIRLGMFSGSGRTPSTEEDFKMAEFHGDDDGLDWS